MNRYYEETPLMSIIKQGIIKAFQKFYFFSSEIIKGNKKIITTLLLLNTSFLFAQSSQQNEYNRIISMIDQYFDDGNSISSKRINRLIDFYFDAEEADRSNSKVKVNVDDDSTTITISGCTTTSTISYYNIIGETVSVDENNNSNQVKKDITGWPKGVYYVKVDAGNIHSVQKIDTSITSEQLSYQTL